MQSINIRMMYQMHIHTHIYKHTHTYTKSKWIGDWAVCFHIPVTLLLFVS